MCSLASGGGDEEEEVVVAVEAVTQGTVYIQPKDTAPTKDATKAFTPKVAAATTSDGPSDADLLREIMPRNPVRTEVCGGGGFGSFLNAPLFQVLSWQMGGTLFNAYVRLALNRGIQC